MLVLGATYQDGVPVRSGSALRAVGDSRTPNILASLLHQLQAHGRSDGHHHHHQLVDAPPAHKAGIGK